MRRPLATLASLLLAAAAAAAATGVPAGFKPIFDGTSRAGWHVSQVNHHGNSTGWSVKDGVLLATQDRPGNGGILLTDKRYRDFEVSLEINPDWRQHWKKGEWNTLRARIEGDVPHIQVWLNGAPLVDWTDSANHAKGGATDGMIAIQMHFSNEKTPRWKPGGFHRFRNIAIRELPR